VRVARQQRPEQFGRVGLKRVQRVRDGLFLDVLDDHRRDPVRDRVLRHHRLELGVHDMQFVDAQNAVRPWVVAHVVGSSHERVHERRADLAGLLVGRLLRETTPRLGDLPVAESVVIQRFSPDDIQDRVLAVAAQQREQLLGAAKHIRVCRRRRGLGPMRPPERRRAWAPHARREPSGWSRAASAASVVNMDVISNA